MFHMEAMKSALQKERKMSQICEKRMDDVTF